MKIKKVEDKKLKDEVEIEILDEEPAEAEDFSEFLDVDEDDDDRVTEVSIVDDDGGY